MISATATLEAQCSLTKHPVQLVVRLPRLTLACLHTGAREHRVQIVFRAQRVRRRYPVLRMETSRSTRCTRTWRKSLRAFTRGWAGLASPWRAARTNTRIAGQRAAARGRFSNCVSANVLALETGPDEIVAMQQDSQRRLATDYGRKDAVLVWPGESVRVAVDFTLPFPGPQSYRFHCHNLEHEDGGMMLPVLIV